MPLLPTGNSILDSWKDHETEKQQYPVSLIVIEDDGKNFYTETIRVSVETYAFALRGQCQWCLEVKDDVQIRRQNAAYVEDYMNFVVLCDPCHADNEENWRSAWDDYNSSRI